MNGVSMHRPSADQHELLRLYGLFMVSWSILETVVQAGIMKFAGLEAQTAVLLTGKLQFNPRVQILLALLKQSGAYPIAIKLLHKAEGLAHRNVLVHGVVIVGDVTRLTFVKYDGGASIKRSFTALELSAHTLEVNERTAEIQECLGITNKDIQAIGNATLAFAQ